MINPHNAYHYTTTSNSLDRNGVISALVMNGLRRQQAKQLLFLLLFTVGTDQL
jgi:hypothetical protein